ncbi:MAG: cobyric acid synthase, partial [Gammaproteobacteria bacterium]|nr:cobyric acid synthase [Gammaproteobacteria bacterium]
MTKVAVNLPETNPSFAHGGHIRNLADLAGCAADELLDFSANINPLGPPESLRRTISRHLESVTHYPDPHCRALREAIAAMHSITPEQVVCGNGSTELLYALPLAFSHRLSATSSVVNQAVIPVPSYLDYATAFTRAGLRITSIPLDAVQGFAIDWQRVDRALVFYRRNFERNDGQAHSGSGCVGPGRPEMSRSVVIVGQPGNPSGALFDPADLLDVADRHPDTLFVVDEAFADFVADDSASVLRGCAPHHNIIVLRSMTKFYGIPGLRLGYALAPEPLARQLAAFLPPWSVGSLAQAVGVAVLEDRAYANETRITVSRLRQQLQRGLLDFANPGDMTIFPSAANYLLIRLERSDLDAPRLARELLAYRIAIRVCDNYEGLDSRYFRVAVRTENENARFLDALSQVLGDGGKTPKYVPGGDVGRERQKHHRRALPRAAPPTVPAVMFQGTASNAGKSVLSAAFCRILLQDGYRVAPFKAQNMSLNSHVTRTGGEMGRAQVVQAQACRRDPDVRMNPVLLKPSSDTGAQIIVMGKPVGNMDVDAYIQYKPKALQAVRSAYDALSSEVDVMVIEGAGSPGEVNLKHHDIVNMAMADYARAQVLLVGDIDRGGVFAAFVGTLEVLAEWERALVAGFVINRFRGQRALLDDAIDYVRAHTGLPTFGVSPYLQALNLPEEDSVTFKSTDRVAAQRSADQVEIALIDLPHIA